jgi:hypothetical protein
MTGYRLEFAAQTDPVRIDWVPADASLFSPDPPTVISGAVADVVDCDSSFSRLTAL